MLLITNGPVSLPELSAAVDFTLLFRKIKRQLTEDRRCEHRWIFDLIWFYHSYFLYYEVWILYSPALDCMDPLYCHTDHFLLVSF